MTRRQVRRMIRQEGIATALPGAVLGVPLGVGLAAAVMAAFDGSGFPFALPLETLGTLALVTVGIGVVAAAFPARRTARLDVLRALQYE